MPELDRLLFHEFLDQWRAGQGWTIQRLADELDVSQSLVSKWLHADPRRRVRPNRKTMRRIAELTGAPPVDLLRMAGYFEEGDLESGVVTDPDLVMIYAAWPRLSNGVREAIRILVGAGTRVSGSSNGRVSEAGHDGAVAEDGDAHAPDGGLLNCKNPVQRPITAPVLRAALA